ncbi:class I histocompatibility antigen, F10 alpha chain-like [Clupea harengus]|uniref:Class I histocompatibility antigen, F10 alpha chain-like n=1 Tax=Clupea harengus TaxID=7950 RepID=A0A8M1KRY2_CLUHA|nr:class I histocompatibility antigen, F10 alpha chain-like [Clupea harengus]
MPDGSLKFERGVDEYSYDGMDFLSFDMDSMQWVAPVHAAVATKQKWDGVPTLNQYTKGYLETECVRWLGDFRRYRDEKEKQTDPSKIHLFAKDGQSSDTFNLTCMATGLYSRNTEISILKGDWSVKKGCKEPTDFLPNDDGTYQIRLSVDAKKSEIDDYGCEVNQGDQKTTLVAQWPKDGILSAAAPSFIGLCVPVVVGVLVVVLVQVIVIVGAICVKRGIIGKFSK